jgi:hypothetical protein
MKADCVSGIGTGGLCQPIERTMLTMIAAMAAKHYVMRADEK